MPTTLNTGNVCVTGPENVNGLAHDHLESQELFQMLSNVHDRLVPRGRRFNVHDVLLSPDEMKTLRILRDMGGTAIVGSIQKALGVLPAQMSRVIRNLEDRELPLIECKINPNDKRKINVSFTPYGEQVLHNYEEGGARQLEDHLSPDEMHQMPSAIRPLVERLLNRRHAD